MDEALAQVIRSHSDKLSELKRIAGHGSNMSIHLLQAEINTLKHDLAGAKREVDRLKADNRSLATQIVCTS